MKIEELDDVGFERNDDACKRKQIAGVDAKRALVGAGARILFYPTLLYNVFRNKIQAEFRWWDEVDQAHGIDHLVIPTRDYLFAPSIVDIRRAVDFIHRNSSSGRTTYVHCKAGRGRSTTIVLCYLVECKHMTPAAALEYVRSRRPRVLLAPSQWKAVQEFSRQRPTATAYSTSGDAVLITKADLEGYHGPSDNNDRKELVVVSRTTRTRPMMTILSCLFASWKVSAVSGPVTGRRPETRVY